MVGSPPDHGPGPLWADGKPVDLASLGLDRDLVVKVAAWNASYEETKVPIEGTGDAAWLLEGKRLLSSIRDALSRDYRVVVTEPWWGEEPT
jgi:hypothetical protein